MADLASASWILYEIEEVLPNGARWVDVGFEGERYNGTQLDVYLDDLAVVLESAPLPPSSSVRPVLILIGL